MSAPEKTANSVSNDDPLVERLRAIRTRIGRRLARPDFKQPDLNLPPLDSLKAAQDSARELADAIGTVNPRRPGVVNDLLQTGKRSLARATGWIIRPQRDFNRAVVESFARTSEALEATNRNLAALAEAIGRSGEMHRQAGEELDAVEAGLEEKIRFEQAGMQQFVQGTFEKTLKLQEARTYELLEQLQGQIWKAMENLQEEIRVVRQRMTAQTRAESARVTGDSAAPAEMTKPSLGLDYFQLQRHFRGSEADIRSRQSFYLPLFQSRNTVLDIACGRGEFLELMREANVNARGVDLDSGMVGECLEKGLQVVQADAFSYLDTIPDKSLDGIFCAQFVEHLEPEVYVRLVSRCAEKLTPGGILAIETPNPECLAIFSQTFFLDPTHVRPIPPALMRLLFAEAGLVRIATHFLSPASAVFPVVPQLPVASIPPDALKAWNDAATRFNETFFGGMDYAVVGYRS